MNAIAEFICNASPFEVILALVISVFVLFIAAGIVHDLGTNENADHSANKFRDGVEKEIEKHGKNAD